MQRRDFLIYSLFCCLPLSGNSDEKRAWHLGHHGNFEFKKMAKNLYVMHGINTGKDDDAQCFLHNPAFIESKNGLIVIDSGASYRVGLAVMKQIERISSKPIIAIFNTHHHSDHWFANGAMIERYPKAKIYAHQNFINSAKEQYFSSENSNRNTLKAKQVSFPNVFVKDGQKIEIDGEHFYIQHPRLAHTSSDITILHQNTQVLFLGDTVLESTLGYFVKGSSILENVSFLEKLMHEKEYSLYVVGHGNSGKRKETIEPYLFYLKSVQDEVKKAYDKEKSVFELDKVKENLLATFSWKDDFNFPLNFLDTHIEFVYWEYEERSF